MRIEAAKLQTGEYREFRAGDLRIATSLEKRTEAERLTVVLNAYLLPVMDRYMSSLRTTLGEAGYRGDVFTMASGGGIRGA